MRKIVAWILVVLWCLVIFYFSAEDRSDSHQRSKEISQIVNKVIERVLDSESVALGLNKSMEHYIRKASHVVEYFILTIFVFNAFILSKIRCHKRYMLSFLIPIVYASFDELHQSYVPGRGPMIKDVFIDGIGVLLGLFFCYVIFSNRKAIRGIVSRRRMT